MVKQLNEEVADLPYVYSYHRELSPTFLSLLALHQGVRFDANRPLRYLELGMGQGVSLCVHAASNGGEYWGNDINEQHLAHARELAAASGANLHVLKDSFSELLQRSDLPKFDVIVAHGIWTWVSDEDHASIVECVRRHLAPGGVFYLSYNCIAGWSAALPLRELMRVHAQASAPGLSVTSRIASAVDFARELAGADFYYFKTNPRVVAQLNLMSSAQRAYLAHEFFGANWALSSFAEVAELLRAADLRFLTTTALLRDNEFAQSAESRRWSVGVADTVLKETVQDLYFGNRFRQDVFVKDPLERLTPDERIALFRARRFVLTTPIEVIPPRVVGHFREIDISSSEMRTLIAALAAQDYSPKSGADLETKSGGLGAERVIDHVMLLLAANLAQVAQHADAIERARPLCKALNDVLCSRARSSGSVGVLASPVLGAGLEVGQLVQLFLLARSQGETTTSACAEFALRCLDGTGARIIVDGKPTPVARQHLAELTEMAHAFEREMLPILRAIGIA